MEQPPVIGRLAPSPTGSLHLGHASSFLLAWWHARSQGGRVVLRLEDVDVERASQEHTEAAVRDLEWLGLDWDGTPRLQSTGLERIVQAAHTLESRGQAFACTCSRGELRARGAPQAGHDELAYNGHCRGRFASLDQAERESGKSAGLRFRIAPGVQTFVDENFGPQAFDVAGEVGDFMILRRSRLPAYQLAVVVDDAFDSVTEVVRGSDLLPSTARQMRIQRALDLPSPRYFHVPLVVDANGRRLAKREAALGLSQLREAGTDPRAVVGFVARTTGQLQTSEQAPRLSASELLATFDPRKVTQRPIAIEPDAWARLARAR